jgi:hypothetical protein
MDLVLSDQERPVIKQMADEIGADVLDFVRLKDGRMMAVDDVGHAKQLPVNPKATDLYHKVCRPGTTHQIRGDVVLFLEDEFE